VSFLTLPVSPYAMQVLLVADDACRASIPYHASGLVAVPLQSLCTIPRQPSYPAGAACC
jgi:hypothetical protein